MQIDQQHLTVLLSQNQYLPDEGPKVVAMILDFSLASSYELDALIPQQLTRFLSMLQTVFIDLKDSAQPLLLTVENTNQVIKAKARTQGYYTVTAPNPIKLTFESTAGIAVPVLLINAPIPGAVWATQ